MVDFRAGRSGGRAPGEKWPNLVGHDVEQFTGAGLRDLDLRLERVPDGVGAAGRVICEVDDLFVIDVEGHRHKVPSTRCGAPYCCG